MDESGRVRAERDSATELREKKRVLAALVVHDLRSPLAAIHGYLELLRGELLDGAAPPPGQSLAYIDDATTLVGKALSLVATILDVDELEDGILRAAPSQVKLRDLVERARAGNRANFEIRELTIDIDLDPEMIVRIDRELFGRVVENLLDNAVRYAPRKGKVSIIAKRDERGVELAIGNNGPPVPPDERAKIFGRYHQVEARRASARQNRGLGLYFCKLAVDAHDGSIHVEQRGELGAVFVVRIPG
ncbi:MAG: ATP-binding protein [Proteobacteria bacterium]|nr:ATP-binding protein [Pseudomonadota bacterium]